MEDNLVSIEKITIAEEIKMAGELVSSISVPNTIDNQNQNENTIVVSDEKLVGVYDEVLDNIRQDRKQVDEFIDKFESILQFINLRPANSVFIIRIYTFSLPKTINLLNSFRFQHKY